MKTSTKILLALAAVLIIAGLVCLVGVLASNNWKIGSMGSEPKTLTVDITDSFNDIAVDSDTEDVSFFLSEDGKCRVEFSVDEKEEPKAEVKDGVLTVTTVDNGKWYDLSWFSFGKHYIKVYLPKAEFASLTVTEDTGDVSIPKELSFASVTVKTDTGDVQCAAPVSGAVRVETDTGDIRMNGVSCSEMSIRVSTGRVELSSVSCEGSITVKVSTGKTIMTDVTCGSFTTNGSTGDVNMTNVIATGAFDIERSTGDVRFDRCDASEITVETDTGDVTGSLLSEKVFIVKSDTGRINVPETVSGGKCKITTDTGDIKITIG